MQKKKPFIPLMMEEGYEADGWLGMLLGTSLWYAFYGASVSSESAFESRMSLLRREIGDRGRADAASGTSALHSQLLACKLSALRKRARASGVSEADLEEADDADDIKAKVVIPRHVSSVATRTLRNNIEYVCSIKNKWRGCYLQVVDLIMTAETATSIASASGIRGELQSLKLSVLRKKAIDAGVSYDELEKADDADDIKLAVIDLIVATRA